MDQSECTPSRTLYEAAGMMAYDNAVGCVKNLQTKNNEKKKGTASVHQAVRIRGWYGVQYGNAFGSAKTVQKHQMKGERGKYK